jgi:O-acetyl-ADP-ribose deacetylase (regulator of RNase III)
MLTQIGRNISVINGDMFSSKMQTLAITVNLQGTMGKGLALRAKQKFPEVDEVYQEACRAKKVRAGHPFLYKREDLLYHKWFLLFATKRHWRANSRLEDIESGLDWVKSNFKDEGIQSLAMPALGCGLGGLDWADVGPMMCRYLHGIGIPVEIYLPHEGDIDSQYLEESYLLPHLEQIPF